MTEQVLAPVTTPADLAKNLTKNIVKLDKADAKAAEHDTAVKELNEEIIGMASGEKEQTIERSLTHVAKELGRSQAKAESIRTKTREDAQSVVEDFRKLEKEVARLLAGYGIDLHAEEAEAADVEEKPSDDVAEEEVE